MLSNTNIFTSSICTVAKNSNEISVILSTLSSAMSVQFHFSINEHDITALI